MAISCWRTVSLKVGRSPCRKKGAIESTPTGQVLDSWVAARILKQVLNHSLDLVAELDQLFGALSDGSRRTMVAGLSRAPATVKQLPEPLTMSLPAVLQHLRVLE